MNTSNRPLRFGFVGFGLIGGSIARSLKLLYPDAEVVAYNYRVSAPHPKLEKAKSDGILTGISASLKDFSVCDAVFLCAPVVKNVEYVEKLAPYLSGDCILTDVGSVKGNIHKAVEKHGLSDRFVGGHPMTGSEKTGYGNSSPDYLKGAYYILTPAKGVRGEYVDWMINFVKASGAICEVMDYEEHDAVTAAISHCPHIISAALINAVASKDADGRCARLAAGGLKDITRISSSSPEIWQNICLANSERIVDFLDGYIDVLRKAKEDISGGDGEALMDFFKSAKEYRDGLR